MLREQLKEIEKNAFQELEAAEDLPRLEDLRVTYLGKKGLMTSILKRIVEIPVEQRPEIGKLANEVKGRLTQALTEARQRVA